MALVLWDSKSLPRSRGRFYSKKDDCITRLRPATFHTWLLYYCRATSLLQFRSWTKCEKGSNVPPARWACRADTGPEHRHAATGRDRLLSRRHWQRCSGLGKRRPKEGGEGEGNGSYICIFISLQLSVSKVLSSSYLSLSPNKSIICLKVTMMFWPRLPNKTKWKQEVKEMKHASGWEFPHSTIRAPLPIDSK